MNLLFHQLIDSASATRPNAEALSYHGKSLSYVDLHNEAESFAVGLQKSGLQVGGRVAIYLPKQEETVIALLAISRAGGIFVPINPILKPLQVAHILSDSGACLLITSQDRAKLLVSIFPKCKSLQQVIIVDSGEKSLSNMLALQRTTRWQELLLNKPSEHPSVKADDSVAILYTSGSTGRPKGVVLSHRNLVTGAQSVSQYLNIHQDDRILALLPFSFDYGLNQLTTAFHSGACAVMMNYMLPQEVIKQIAIESITGLAAVPSLWAQLATIDWPETARQTLRFITNSGSTMPPQVLNALQEKLPHTDIFLMYGLTEAFRSTYLPPKELLRRPTSIGKPIPNAQIRVVKPDGSLCSAGEPGELIHQGPLVAKGYWNNPEKTAKRFRVSPAINSSYSPQALTVWSGDIVSMDEDGYLYFIGRKDEMIKTSGYRVSPTEIEETIYESGLTNEVVAFGVPHPTLGQAIVAVVTPATDTPNLVEKLQLECKKKLPLFMVPMQIEIKPEIPKTPHGKYDRKYLVENAQTLFTNKSSIS